MSSPSTSPKKPNFLIVVADDLGFSDTGPYGSEIATPTLDRLAREGLTMTGFHTASACSPTRAMLLSGTDNHIAGLGQMAEFMFATGAKYWGQPGYEGYLNWRVAALPEIMQDNGYHTIMSGKWHLGLKKEIAPHARGFDKSFVYLPGAGNHYNNEPQLDSLASSFIIPALRSDNLWMRDGDILDRKNEEHIPKDFYSTTNFTTELLTYLKQRNNESSSSPADGTISDDQDGEKSEGEAQHDNKKPFFAYLAYTAPHWPLQAPRATIDKYTGVYSDGPHALRQQRLDALIARGLVPKDVEPAPMVGDETLPPWSSLSDEEKALSSRRMETYAAMVDLIDQNLARVVDYLEETGELDNTFILFMSDNGAEGKLLEALPVSRGMPLSKIVEEYYDNSMENIGNADSFVWYGPQWACAATAPSKGFKIMVTEGGIRCPCIVRYPGFAASSGKVTHDFTTVMDILPTILEMAGVPHPGTSFRGREVVLPRGRSWKAWLENGAQSTVHENGAQDVMGWELFGRRAIRKGNWKAVFEPAPKGTEEWQLFDLSKDAGEIHDLAEQEPKVLEDLLVEWERYFTETGMYDPSTEAAKSKW